MEGTHRDTTQRKEGGPMPTTLAERSGKQKYLSATRLCLLARPFLSGTFHCSGNRSKHRYSNRHAVNSWHHGPWCIEGAEANTACSRRKGGREGSAYAGKCRSFAGTGHGRSARYGAVTSTLGTPTRCATDNACARQHHHLALGSSLLYFS